MLSMKDEGGHLACSAPPRLTVPLYALAPSSDLVSAGRSDPALSEFVQLQHYCKEFRADISPDCSVYETKDLQVILFSIN